MVSWREDVDRLDEARARVEARWHVGGHARCEADKYPEYACREHGHYDCAFWPNGPCVAAATAEEYGKLSRG